MTRRRALHQALSSTLALSFVSSLPLAQELPGSGLNANDYIYASSGGTSQFYRTNVFHSLTPTSIGASVARLPSRWAHRRRTLGALETAITSPEPSVYVTPMGSAVGNGAIHLVDLRGGTATQLVATGNPAGYDLASNRDFDFVFSAEDDGVGHTILRGFSYQVVGTLTPLDPPTLTLTGSPAAYVNRIGVDRALKELHVPTASGIAVVTFQVAFPQMAVANFFSTLPASPTTNPVTFKHNGQTAWIVGTSTFNPAGSDTPEKAGFFSWDSNVPLGAADFGSVPSAPLKSWVPAVGTEELAVVGNGTDAYIYYLLREPGPGTFFVKPSSVGVVRFIGAAAPAVGTILMPDDVGEPFSIPAVYGTRVAFESSFGPPFISTPPGGGEKISIIYSPLDPLGSASVNGVLGNPDPLGGRISTKGMDRPIWSADGTRVFAATSHFPGAPNPGVPGIEALNVPADVLLDQFQGPHTTLSNLPFPNQAILLPSSFAPRDPVVAASLKVSFFGNVFNQGVASASAPTWGEIGQIQDDPLGFTQSPLVPDFPAIFPPAFLDATGSLTPIPGNFGARRTTFNLKAALGARGLVMSAAIGDGIYVQLSGANFLAIVRNLSDAAPTRLPLPTGWITTSEFYSF